MKTRLKAPSFNGTFEPTSNRSGWERDYHLAIGRNKTAHCPSLLKFTNQHLRLRNRCSKLWKRVYMALSAIDSCDKNYIPRPP